MKAKHWFWCVLAVALGIGGGWGVGADHMHMECEKQRKLDKALLAQPCVREGAIKQLWFDLTRRHK